MRMFKWILNRFVLPDGYHLVRQLMTKKFDEKGKWKGEWIPAKTERGAFIRTIEWGKFKT